jgi:heme oxygenase-like protein
MTSEASAQTLNQIPGQSIQHQVERAIDDLLGSFPNPGQLSADQRRGIIARYTAVLEGNFIYWMTATYLSVVTEEARVKILDNLREEVRDCHPGMLRRFAMAAHAVPTDSDALDVYRDLTNVRLFMGRLSGVHIVLTMAFFEGFIQKFMAYLAELAAGQGSVEREYTDVHGVCDITHTQELFRALEAEMKLNPPDSSKNLFEGVDLLSALIVNIVQGAGGKTDLGVYTRLAAS